MQIKYDVIITGSGPAGSTAANILSKKGFQVLLLEKTSFPRKKICAGGLTPRTVELLSKTGVISEEELFLDKV
ncbi:MAG: FAD-dependent monooxygenase, partial [Candidatus Firestonebacteria bacterium]